MIYTLIISSNHLTSGRQALDVAKGIVAQHDQINKIYFLFDGTYVANKYIDMPTDEFNLPKAWVEFSDQYDINLAVCAASGYRRGISKETIAPGFSFGSIGELLESCNTADQVLYA